MNSEMAGISKEEVEALGPSAPTEIDLLVSMVFEFFEGDERKVRLWFVTPNPQLGAVAPRDMIRAGRLDRLHGFIVDAREAEKAAE